jgi:hypothetical protein
MASAFMDRVFGVPMLHDVAVSGDLASRLAKWWTNMFAPEFYYAHEPLFRQKPVIRLANVVRDLTNGTLKPQMVHRRRQVLGGLNTMDREAKFLPKFVSAPITVNQKMASDGTPGTGMLAVVGNNPHQFVPYLSQVMVATHRFWPPQMEVIRREYDDEEDIRVVGIVSARTSSRAMLRMGIGYSVLVRQQAEKGLSTPSVEGLRERQTDNSRAAMHRAIDRTTTACVSAVSAIEAEYNALVATLGSDYSAKPGITQPRVVSEVVTAAQRARAQADAQVLHRTA